jgi:hypothetical protein
MNYGGEVARLLVLFVVLIFVPDLFEIRVFDHLGELAGVFLLGGVGLFFLFGELLAWVRLDYFVRRPGCQEGSGA